MPHTPRAGVASLGFRPTVGGTEPLLEAHVFDFSGVLYGAELEVEFVAKIRDEEKFATWTHWCSRCTRTLPRRASCWHRV